MKLLIALCASVLSAAATSNAGDWPNWRGPHQDGISPQTGLLKSWPKEGPKVLWSAALTGGYSSVVVANGRVFTQTKDKKEDLVVCFDATTGDKLWEYRFACDYADFPTLDKRFLTGPKATPTVDGDRVYAMGNTGLLQCLDARTGKLIWERDLLKLAERKCPEYGYCNSPFIVGDRLFIHPGGSKENNPTWPDYMNRMRWTTHPRTNEKTISSCGVT